MAEFGRSKQAWFATFLDLPHGIPSHDTFWRVFRALDPDQFQCCFLNWIRATSRLIGGQVIAYPGDNQNINANFKLAMQRTIAFFDEYVRRSS